MLVVEDETASFFYFSSNGIVKTIRQPVFTDATGNAFIATMAGATEGARKRTKDSLCLVVTVGR